MALYGAEPEGSAASAVVVIQEAFGVNDHIEDICRRLSKEGYRAVAPHLFHRSGDPVVSYEEIDKVVPHIMQWTRAGLEADLDATFDYLGRQGFPPHRIGVIGFCAGGTVTFVAAAYRALGAAVTFYGGGVGQGRFGIPALVDLAAELKTPWLGLFGDQDTGIPVEEVESLRRAVAAAGVPAEVVRYPDAGHGFHCDARDSYHEPSAKDAWRRTLEWFDKYLGRS
jgi:carboxymethylenebutenolidase